MDQEENNQKINQESQQMYLDIEDVFQKHKQKDLYEILCENQYEEIQKDYSPEISSPRSSQLNSHNSSLPANNFLKNLINLLRTWVKTQNMPAQAPMMSKMLWEAFKNQKKSHLYGQQTKSQKTFIKYCEQFKIQQNIRTIIFEQILQAQEYLKKQTIRQLVLANISYIIKNRRVQNKQQFQNFLYSFLSGLQNGEVRFKTSKSPPKKTN